MTTYEKACRTLGRWIEKKPDEEERGRLEEALQFLEMRVSAEEVQGLAYAMLVTSCLGVAAVGGTLLLLFGFSPLWFIPVPIPALLYLYLRRYPVHRAREERVKCLGEMPGVVTYLIMSLRINPNLERAVEFAQRHSRGIFKRKFSKILNNIRLGVEDAETGLRRVAEEFSEIEEFKRCVELLIASVREGHGDEGSEEGRGKTLDKATGVFFAGMEARIERSARSLNTPVMIVFTFGVILPLVFVALVPFLSLMGVSVSEVMIAIVYIIALPTFLFILVRFIASNRPVTIPPPEVPERGGKRAIVALVPASALLVPALLVDLGPMQYIPILWGVASGLGIFFISSTMGVRKEREGIKRLEREFGETLHKLGIALSEGRSFEDAMTRTDSEFLGEAAEGIRNFNTSPAEALFDDKFGSLRNVYSNTIRGVMEILVSVADKGSKTISRISFQMADHLEKLQKSELEIERSLGGVVSSMKIIAMVVAPLVGGMISSMSVVLADTMEQTQGAQMGFGSGGGLDPALVTTVIATYVMESAVILVLFGNDLLHGGDKILNKFSIGTALPVSIFVFTLCVWVAGAVFGGVAG